MTLPRTHTTLLAAMLAMGLSGCEKAEPPPVDAPSAASAASSKAPAPPPQAAQMPPGHPPLSSGAASGSAAQEPPGAMVDPHAAAQGGREVDGPQPTESKLDGVTLKIPDGWVYEAPEVNSRMPGMSPKAIFRLKPVEGDTENVYVRITHFPGMNVSDEMNLKRWYGMFSQPDGGATADAVSLERFEVGQFSFVVADIPGTMRVAGGSKSDWRMLGVIIKHDRGPHFMKVVGPAGSVEHWKDSVLAYLRSAIAN